MESRAISLIWLNIILTVLTLLGARTVLAAPACSEFFSEHFLGDLNEYAQVKSSFLKTHNNEYSRQVPQETEIKNQCNLGTCHLHSWTSQLEIEYLQKNKKYLKISTHYLSAMHWLKRSLELLDKPNEPIEIKLGSKGSLFSRDMILEYGLIPDTAWTASRDFQTNPIAGRIDQYLRNIIARTRWDFDRRKSVADGKAIMENGREQIRAVFKSLVGEMPKSFAYEGKTYDARSFVHAIFPSLGRDFTKLSVTAGADEAAQIAQLEKLGRELIDHGHSFYMAYENNKHFFDAKTGIMSIAAFQAPLDGLPLSRSQRILYNLTSGLHAVQVVGYDLDPATGQVMKWKVKNSWGIQSGDLGYYHMYADYFHQFVGSISFYTQDVVQVQNLGAPTLQQPEFSF